MPDMEETSKLPTLELFLCVVLGVVLNALGSFTGVGGECSGPENAFFVASSTSRAFASSSHRSRLQPLALGLGQV